MCLTCLYWVSLFDCLLKLIVSINWRVYYAGVLSGLNKTEETFIPGQSLIFYVQSDYDNIYISGTSRKYMLLFIKYKTACNQSVEH